MDENRYNNRREILAYCYVFMSHFFRFKPLWVKRSVCLFFKSLKTRFICDLSRERKKISFDYCINEKKIVPLQSHCARTCART